jgi:hypothetical protein
MGAIEPNIKIPPRHSNRVQAWVWMVLNPGIEALRQELTLLDKGNLSWRFYSKRCEYIRPFRENIERSQWPNFEDFLTDPINEGFNQGIDDHNKAVRQLEFAASRFFEELIQSAPFSKEVARTLEEYRSRARQSPEYPDIDSIERDLPKFVAEYLINGVTVLPYHYTPHKFWEEFRKAFEPYRKSESFQSLIRTSAELKHSAGKLLNALEKHRRLLCSTYDISAAPVTGNITQRADPYKRRR